LIVKTEAISAWEVVACSMTPTTGDAIIEIMKSPRLPLKAASAFRAKTIESYQNR
jgi:hypothetical protein